jgi:XTP/dITP diphosphohydrolase
MMEHSPLFFATSNRHKREEASQILRQFVLLIPPLEVLASTPEETEDTFAGNAYLKARHVFLQTQKPCLAEDSGLCVNALGGKPGVHSARFAGENATDQDNNHKLLDLLGTELDRSAYYMAVVCYINSQGQPFYFEGRINGRIATEAYGKGGFGYDPLFIPEGYSQTFAQLGGDIKQHISHRKRALDLLSSFLSQQQR